MFYYEILLKSENQKKHVHSIWSFFIKAIQYLQDDEIMNKYHGLFTYETI